MRRLGLTARLRSESLPRPGADQHGGPVEELLLVGHRQFAGFTSKQFAKLKVAASKRLQSVRLLQLKQQPQKILHIC
jgi:hypothetical protein